MKKAGFSLLEVLITMSLGFTLIVGAAELVSFSLWAKRRGDMASGMAHALAARLETLKTLPFDAEGLRLGDYSETVEDDLSKTSFYEEWTVEEAGERLKKVRIRISPADRPGGGTALVLYISKDLGFNP
jgi:hypothetical protein